MKKVHNKQTCKRSKTAAFAFQEEDLATEVIDSRQAGITSRGRMD
jgi:hypothetical protein